MQAGLISLGLRRVLRQFCDESGGVHSRGWRDRGGHRYCSREGACDWHPRGVAGQERGAGGRASTVDRLAARRGIRRDPSAGTIATSQAHPPIFSRRHVSIVPDATDPSNRWLSPVYTAGQYGHLGGAGRRPAEAVTTRNCGRWLMWPHGLSGRLPAKAR